jgi:hypothetical protein
VQNASDITSFLGSSVVASLARAPTGWGVRCCAHASAASMHVGLQFQAKFEQVDRAVGEERDSVRAV